jgi:hypothetical protein
MSITSYSELQTAIANWLNRSGDTDLTSVVPDLIMLCENRIYRELRIRPMEVALNSTISSGVIAVPANYVELKFTYIDGSPVQRLTKKDPGWIYENYPDRAAEGLPNFIAREVDNFIFGAYPDSSYTVKGVYYQRLPALSVSNTTNWFITNAPDLLLFGSLCEAEPFLKNDDRIQLWEAKYKTIKDQIINQDKQEAYSGSPVTVTASRY